MKAVKKCVLYVLEGHTSINLANTIKNPDDTTMLCNMHLGYLSDKRLIQLSKRGLLCGYKVIGIDLYKHCIVGKQNGVKFISSMHTTICILDYVHSDLWKITTTTNL